MQTRNALAQRCQYVWLLAFSNKDYLLTYKDRQNNVLNENTERFYGHFTTFFVLMNTQSGHTWTTSGSVTSIICVNEKSILHCEIPIYHKYELPIYD